MIKSLIQSIVHDGKSYVFNFCKVKQNYSRCSTVTICGSVTEFCKTKLACDLESCEIDRTHRVGRPRLGKQRVIIVKFCSYQSKIKVMKCKRNLKGTSIYVNEDLIFFNKVLFNYARSELKVFWCCQRMEKF